MSNMADAVHLDMARGTTVQHLRDTLQSQACSITPSPRQKLSDSQYNTGFNILVRSSNSYPDFIFPQLNRLLTPLFNTTEQISVLEVGPGAKSVLGCLPDFQKRKIRRYEAFEPNQLFAENLEAWLADGDKKPPRFPCLQSLPTIHRFPFNPEHCMNNRNAKDAHSADAGYDVILFCHSMYGMQSKGSVIKKALSLLRETKEGVLAVFHRGESFQLDGLVCHQTASFPNGIVRVADEGQVLDEFCSFIAGFVMHDEAAYEPVRVAWQKTCQELGVKEKHHPDLLSFRLPEVMVAFTRHSASLSELTKQVPTSSEDRQIKNREARWRRPAAICKPTSISHIQQCVQWALKHRVGLTVMAGGHSGHCVWDNVISINMKAFNRVSIHNIEGEGLLFDTDCKALVVAETGCTTGDIMKKSRAAGVTLPLGSRPSVGAGLWLQGGIGHLARMHGLTCDTIVGAVVVSVESSQVLCVGHVPSPCRPSACIRPESEADILWALKGAGTNFGIVVSVTFRAYTAPAYRVWYWARPLSGAIQAQNTLNSFDKKIASKLCREESADVYLYWDDGQLQLGVTMIEVTTTARDCAHDTFSSAISAILETEEDSVKTVDGVGLFDTEMYVSRMHGGHGGGKTSSFKRCVFLKDIGSTKVASRLMKAMQDRPSTLCYLHLLHGGGAVCDITPSATAFGCRGWDFACVITGVWPCGQDGTEVARAAVAWVYSVAEHLLPISRGVYSADLGPDPRDAGLAHRAFGGNRQRLADLKIRLDPCNVLAYACPLPKVPLGPKLILLITGRSCVGKDYCADFWVSMFAKCSLTARAVSISEAIKREYAATVGADAERLLSDRIYKEQHREALTTYFLTRVKEEPQLPEEQFLQVVNEAADVGVLLITGMRDKSPVAAFRHLVPNSQLVEVYVHASEITRRVRKDGHVDSHKISTSKEANTEALTHQPCFTFNNETPGNNALSAFFQNRLLPLAHEDLLRLADMVRSHPDFPRPNIIFRHVLGISQHPGGLALCTSLLHRHFGGDWSDVAAIACCEVGGIVFASPLSLHVNVPLVLIRTAGKLPPPIFSAAKPQSHVSSLASSKHVQKRLEVKVEVEQTVVPQHGSIVVVDDTLATGETLCATLQALKTAGVAVENMSVLVIAEFPVHRGRELLCKRGFSAVCVRSLLSFDGA